MSAAQNERDRPNYCLTGCPCLFPHAHDHHPLQLHSQSQVSYAANLCCQLMLPVHRGLGTGEGKELTRLCTGKHIRIKAAQKHYWVRHCPFLLHTYRHSSKNEAFANALYIPSGTEPKSKILVAIATSYH